MRGFDVKIILMYNQLETVRTLTINNNIKLNVAAINEYAPSTKRNNYMIKDRGRTEFHSTPFPTLTTYILVDIIIVVLFWFNIFRVDDGLSRTLRPRALVTRYTITYYTHCTIYYKVYAHMHIESDNTMTSLIIGTITWPTEK